MSLCISSWMRLIGLFFALFAMPITAMHAKTPTTTAVPFDRRAVIEWNTLSFDELQEWFADKPQNTILSIPEGSTFSMKMEIENDLFAFTSQSPSEPPILRVRAKKGFFLTRRGSGYWIKEENGPWSNLEKVLKRAVCNAQAERQYDEFGPIIHFRITITNSPTVSNSSQSAP